jgi:hypothetical protein
MAAPHLGLRGRQRAGRGGVDGNQVMLAPNGYTKTTHTFARPGTYFVTARHVDELGWSAITRVWVEIGPQARAASR